ncbi:MAG: hypothetical protein WBE78_17845, partial [Candidatus Binataceae bacterium]
MDSSPHAEGLPAGRPSAAAGVANGAAVPHGLPLKRSIRPAPLRLTARQRLMYWLMVGTLHLLSLIPDFILVPLGALGGLIGYLLDRRHLRIGMKNLEIAFPERSVAERRRILRASYVNLGRAGAEYI